MVNMKKIILMALLLLAPLASFGQTRPHWSQIKEGGDARQYGAKGDGVTDDSAAIAAAIADCGGVILRKGTFLIQDTIILPSESFLYIDGAEIRADVASEPLFQTATSAYRVSVEQNGGIIRGTAGSVLKAHGTSDDPSVAGCHVAYLRVTGLQVESTAGSISKLFDFRSVKTLFVSDCFCTGVDYAVYAQGKSVEHMISNCFFYGNASTSSCGFHYNTTFSAAPEGLHVTNCIVDAFNYGFFINALYAMTVSNSYIGTAGVNDGFAMYFNPNNGAGATTTFLNIGGNNLFLSPIKFAAGYHSYFATIDGFIMSPQTATTTANAIHLDTGASNITVSNGTFVNHSLSPNGVAVRLAGGGFQIVLSDLLIRSPYSKAIYMTDSAPPAGAYPVFKNIVYKGAGATAYDLSYAALINNCSGSNIGTYIFGATNIPAGNYAVGATLASITMNIAEGQRGSIEYNFPYSGASTTSQLYKITAPAGLDVADGSGWGDIYLTTSTATGCASRRIPFICTTTATSAISLTNEAGNTVTVGSHGVLKVILE